VTAVLAASLEDPPSGRTTPVWFDSLSYCREKLLSGAPLPWSSPGDLSAFFAKAQGMFRSDALLVNLLDLYAQRVAQDEALPAAMAARTRPAFALRTLLADESARAVAQDAMTAVGSTDSTTPVVLSVPSPARWLEIASDQAGAPTATPTDTAHVETAAMYVADLLRIFAEKRVDGLLLDEGSTSEESLVDVESYRPVLNVAGNYGWPVWLRSDGAPCWPDGEIAGVAGWLGLSGPTRAVGRWGVVLPAGSGLDSGPLPATDGGAVLAVVPADGDPELVMRWARELT
jgi:hypothetical protein